MKIIPRSIVKKHIAQKIKQRNNYRDLLVSIPENLNNKSDYDVLKKSENALKALADKHGVGFNFTNGEGLFEGETIVELSHKRTYFDDKLISLDNGFYWPGVALEKVASIFPKITDKLTLLKDIKKIIAEHPNTSPIVVNKKNIVKLLVQDYQSTLPR